MDVTLRETVQECVRKLALFASLFISAAAGAQTLTGVAVEPQDVLVHVGETAILRARGIVGCCSSFPWRVMFKSAEPTIATVDGLMLYPELHADVNVTGRAPGVTSVLSPTGYPLAQVRVICAEEAAIAALTVRQSASLKQPVLLAVSAPSVEGRTFSWYRGLVGDVSRPIPGGGPTITFVPDGYGTSTVWVSSSTACSTSTAQFQIDVAQPHRRAAKH